MVVLNYQYVLDPKVSQAAFMATGMGRGGNSSLGGTTAPQSKDPSIIVFDEAHNIDNVCIEALSVNVNVMTLERSRQNLTKLDKEIEHLKSVDKDRLNDEYKRLVRGLHNTGQIDDATAEGLANPVLPDDVANEAIPGSIRKAEYFVAMMRKVVLFLNTYIRYAARAPTIHTCWYARVVFVPACKAVLLFSVYRCVCLLSYTLGVRHLCVSSVLVVFSKSNLKGPWRSSSTSRMRRASSPRH